MLLLLLTRLLLGCVDCDPLVLCTQDLGPYNYDTCIPNDTGTALLFGDLFSSGQDDLLNMELLAQDMEEETAALPFLAFVQLPSHPLGLQGMNDLFDDGFVTGAHVLEDERIATFYNAEEHDLVLLDVDGCEHSRYPIGRWDEDLRTQILNSWLEVVE